MDLLLLLMYSVILQTQCTPLHHAAVAGHSEVVSALIKAGADIEARTAVSCNM